MMDFKKILEGILNETFTGDVIDILPKLPKGIVQTIVTSPPYFAVRDYKLQPTKWPEVTYHLFGFPITIPPMECCLGLEKTPMEYIGHMIYVFRLVREVLRDDGTLWVNIGDCYNSKSGGYTPGFTGKHNYISHNTAYNILKNNRKLPGMKQKDMVGIPWMLAFALRDDGWYLRQEIIWHKQNPMPESVNDRCTKAHEQIFLLSKSKRYFYDAYAISTEISDASVLRMNQTIENQTGSTRANAGLRHNGPLKAYGKYMPSGWGQNTKYEQRDPRDIRDHKNLQRDDKNHPMHEGRKVRTEEEKKYGINGKGFQGHSGYLDKDGNIIGNGRANKKSVWAITTQSFTEAHFATFPEDLPVDPIKAGTSDYGACACCGAPYKRTFEKELKPLKDAPKKFVIDARDHAADQNSQGSNRQKDGHKSGHFYEYKNFSWVKTCKCDTAEIVPCIVMDCFSGAGTTKLIARKLNRDTICIEKNTEYRKIEDSRLYKELGMFR